MFATCSTLVLDPAARTVGVLLAGHHEPLLCAGGTAHIVKSVPGLALGIMPGHRGWQASSTVLPPAGALMLYTDGLVEGYRGPGRERLDTTGLVELIADAPDADGLLDQLISTARTLNAGRHADDLAILHLAWG